VSKNDASSDIMPLPAGQEIHPRGFLEVISYIEQNFANELGGAVIRDTFLTTKQRLEFFEVGFRSSFLSGLISALLTPFAIGVVERYIPVFGSTSPDTFDMFFAFLLAVGYSLGFAIFLAYACTKFVGTYTRAMARNLLGGVVTGAVLKAILAFIGFHFLYIVVMTDTNLQWAAKQLYRLKLSRSSVLSVYDWVLGFRGVFLTSAWFVLGVTIVFIAIPSVAMVLTIRRNRKLIEAGVVHVE
jgi:hypothetical protein